MLKFESRFILYAKFNERSPEQMLAIDEIRHPDNRMQGFTMWLQAKRAAWCQMPGHRLITQFDHDAFDFWLSDQLPDILEVNRFAA